MSAVPFAAGIACIEKLKKLDAPAMFRKLGTQLTDGLTAAAANNGFNLKCSGEPALFYTRITNDDSLFIHQDWIQEMVSRGIFLTSHHNHFINASLTEDDIKYTIDVAEDAFNAVRKRHPEAF